MHAEELTQVVGDALRLRRGRHRDDDRSPRRRPGQCREEQRTRRVAHRNRYSLTAARGTHRRLVGEKDRDTRERRARFGTQNVAAHVVRVL